MSDPLGLFVSVPVASFRVAQAREYLATYPVPPPATVYGMLLSAIGEADRQACTGAEIAVGLVDGAPAPSKGVSRVLRTLWHVKSTSLGPGQGNNRRPDFQELLTGLHLKVWVRAGEHEQGGPTLREKLGQALESPRRVHRFGGLSLGESSHLVDELRPRRVGDGEQGQLLVQDLKGTLALPIWPDHVGSAGTRWGQYALEGGALSTYPRKEAWTPILPP